MKEEKLTLKKGKEINVLKILRGRRFPLIIITRIKRERERKGENRFLFLITFYPFPPSESCFLLIIILRMNGYRSKEEPDFFRIFSPPLSTENLLLHPLPLFTNTYFLFSLAEIFLVTCRRSIKFASLVKQLSHSPYPKLVLTLYLPVVIVSHQLTKFSHSPSPSLILSFSLPLPSIHLQHFLKIPRESEGAKKIKYSPIRRRGRRKQEEGDK